MSEKDNSTEDNQGKLEDTISAPVNGLLGQPTQLAEDPVTEHESAAEEKKAEESSKEVDEANLEHDVSDSNIISDPQFPNENEEEQKLDQKLDTLSQLIPEKNENEDKEPKTEEKDKGDQKEENQESTNQETNNADEKKTEEQNNETPKEEIDKNENESKEEKQDLGNTKGILEETVVLNTNSLVTSENPEIETQTQTQTDEEIKEAQTEEDKKEPQAEEDKKETQPDDEKKESQTDEEKKSAQTDDNEPKSEANAENESNAGQQQQESQSESQAKADESNPLGDIVNNITTAITAEPESQQEDQQQQSERSDEQQQDDQPSQVDQNIQTEDVEEQSPQPPTSSRSQRSPRSSRPSPRSQSIFQTQPNYSDDEVEKVAQQFLKGDKITVNDPSIFGPVITNLEEKRDTFQQQNQFNDYWKAEKAIESAKTYQMDAFKKISQTEYQKEIKSKKEAVEQEYSQFLQDMKEKEGELEKELQELQKSMRAKQQQELENNDKEWQSEYKMRQYNRSSQQLRLLRHQQQLLLNAKRFDESMQVSKVADKLKAKETAENHKQMNIDYLKARNAILERHEVEKSAMALTLETRRGDFQHRKEVGSVKYMNRLKYLAAEEEVGKDPDRVWLLRHRNDVDSLTQRSAKKTHVRVKTANVSEFNTLPLPPVDIVQPAPKKSKSAKK